MSDYSKFYEARDIVTDILQKDFVGPVSRDEILSELPTQYYIMGKLYPQSKDDDPFDLARNPFLENEIETYDASVSLSNQKNPSSTGLTCALKSGTEEITVSGSYAFYVPVLYEEAEKNGIDTAKWKEKEKEPEELWVRKEFTYNENIRLTDQKVEDLVNLPEGLQLQVYTHNIFENGERIITVALVNVNQSESDALNKAKWCAFQPRLKITGNDESIFTDVNRQRELSTDEEILELEMLYSDVCCYAQGHGCSVTWDSGKAPMWVAISWFPSYDLHQMMAAQADDRRVLSMKFLAEGSAAEIIHLLTEFNSSYQRWIKNLVKKAEALPERYVKSAAANINKCLEAYERIKKSVGMLENSAESDKRFIKAFQLANEAMFLQRKQSLRKSGKSVDDADILWYPFQLAFVLYELSSFTDPSGEERKTVDLLWFPTGGGKTEAYLGITAFVIFLRRLRNPADDGVTVIMRYTLRLLTLQQFERAGTLIFACEILRRKYHLGGTEISVGLWVGGKLTPNRLADARKSIHMKQTGAQPDMDESDPCQIRVCPWCGKKISYNNYSVKLKENRMIIKCENPECDFYEYENGLPVHIVDEAIYEYLPTFIVATVDKFAQIPLSDKPASLFGISSHKKPPELIIQDELHLISGPLGTMAGIYEAAISKLCERDGVGAKVIASTATIRNAKNQIKALYARPFTQFPPQGISAKDSYFAVESTADDRPVRKYFGVMGIGTTATTALIRADAALLYASRYLEKLGFEDKVIDNFWTITGYFNSLRELGGASTQILDDVQSRFSYLANTKFSAMTPNVNGEIKYDNFEELTSRMNNSEITRIIQDKLKRRYHEGKHNDVYDFLLASNMISVGVDIGRLGTMVVAGQPKTNAEYIQATSRVGRDNPGLIITVYNATRSRDRSHYEQFQKYHSALYRYVEATSLTPFADRARDRGLHALYVSLCRYLVPGMLKNENAVNYNPEDERIKNIQKMILEYVKKVDPEEYDAVLQELTDIEEEWELAATGSLVYKSFKQEKMLLKGDTEISRFRTMNSMRNVDVQAGIYLLGR